MKKLVTLVLLSLLLPAPALFAQGNSAFIGNNPDHGPTLPSTCSQTSGQTYFLTTTQGPNVPGLYSCIGGTFTLTGGTLPTGTSNLLPAVVSTASSSGGNVTSLAITPPGSIVNGNTLWIFIAAKGVTSETWTPAAGWSQVGSTLTSTVTSLVVTAKFCKIANNESGNYTFTWNNATAGGVQVVATQISGTTCTPDNSASATGKASTLTVNPFSVTNKQDLLLITNGQANNTTLSVSVPNNTTQLNTPGAIGIGVFTVPLPSTTTPTITTVNFAGGAFSDDTTLEVTALSPTLTSTSLPYAINTTSQSIVTNSINASGGATFGSGVSSPFFVVPCTSTPPTLTTPSGTFAVKRIDGLIQPVITLQCATSSLLLDPSASSTNLQFAGGGQTGGANLLINSGFVDFISRDGAAGSQDLNVLTLSTAVTGDSVNASRNNLIIGCLLEPCTGGTILGDIILRAQPNNAVRLANGVTDELWVNSTGFVGAVPVNTTATPAAPTVTPTCPNGTCTSTWSYAVDCLDANGGTTAVSANGTTAANAATLDSTHFNTITWTRTLGCKTYEVRRTVVATSPATTGIIATKASGLALSFVDNNVAGDSSSAPGTNTTGTIAVAGTSGGIKNVANTATMGMTLKKGTGAGNYTTASTTYAVVDSTNLCFTVLIPSGWKLQVVASGDITTATSAVTASVAITDNAACGTANSGILVEATNLSPSASNPNAFSLGWVITGDGATHNVALQYKTSVGADVATITNSSSTLLPTMIFTLMPSN